MSYIAAGQGGRAMTQEESGEIHADRDKKVDGKRTKIQAGRMEGEDTNAFEDRGSCHGPLSLVTIHKPPYVPVPRALHANHSPSLDRLASMFSSWGLGFLKGEVVWEGWGEGRHLDAAGR
jgi:hypothetical protein